AAGDGQQGALRLAPPRDELDEKESQTAGKVRREQEHDGDLGGLNRRPASTTKCSGRKSASSRPDTRWTMKAQYAGWLRSRQAAVLTPSSHGHGDNGAPGQREEDHGYREAARVG